MKILVADDNVDAAQTLATLLELLGYDVAVAYDGLAAVKAATSFAPQAILCDIGMPGLDGYGVARRIRTLRGAKAPPLLIACTGYGNQHDRSTALEAGFDHHMTKPVVIVDLLQLLTAAPEAGAGQASL